MPKKFTFGLDKLLEIRQQKEEESKRLFTESQRDRRITQEKLDELKENYEKYKGIKPNEDVVYQKLKRYYLQGLQGGIKTTQKELAIKDREVEKRRVELTQKQVERKTVETLKNKKYMAYVKEQDRVEQITIDELGLYAFIRKQNEI